MSQAGPHPHVVFAKGMRVVKSSIRAVVYAPDEARYDWVHRELSHEEIVIQVGRGISHIIAALVDDPPPRPQILVIDFDAIGPGEIMELHTIRERGWTGTIFALGKVPIGIRKSLKIEQVLATLVDNALRLAVAEIGFDKQTRRLPVLTTTP
jgi:hypothetical protein